MSTELLLAELEAIKARVHALELRAGKGDAIAIEVQVALINVEAKLDRIVAKLEAAT